MLQPDHRVNGVFRLLFRLVFAGLVLGALLLLFRVGRTPSGGWSLERRHPVHAARLAARHAWEEVFGPPRPSSPPASKPAAPPAEKISPEDERQLRKVLEQHP